MELRAGHTIQGVQSLGSRALEFIESKLQLAPDYWLEPGSAPRAPLAGWWLLGAALALYFWSLPGGLELLRSDGRTLRIDLLRLPPERVAAAPAPALEQSATPVPVPAGPEHVASVEASSAEQDATTRGTLPLNLRAQASELVRQWPSQDPAAGVPADYPTQGLVFDSALRARLETTAPARPAAESTAAMPNALGETQLILGDQCVVTQDLDNRALRGMKLWWVGLCNAPAKKDAELKLR